MYCGRFDGGKGEREEGALAGWNEVLVVERFDVCRGGPGVGGRILPIVVVGLLVDVVEEVGPVRLVSPPVAAVADRLGRQCPQWGEEEGGR